MYYGLRDSIGIKEHIYRNDSQPVSKDKQPDRFLVETEDIHQDTKTNGWSGTLESCDNLCYRKLDGENECSE